MQFPRRYAPNRFLFYAGLLSLVALFGVLSGQRWLVSAQSSRPQPLAQSVNVAKSRSGIVNVAQQTVVPLISGTAVTGTINGASVANQCSLGTTQYTIPTTADTKRLQISLSGNQDIDLYARFGAAISSQSDYNSDSADSVEDITITPNIMPALQAGTYYIAITNCSTSAANFTLTATVYNGGGQITEELKVDDNSADDAFLQNGLTVVNRLTPLQYPSQLQKIRIQFAAFQGQPNPTGAQIRLLAFNLPTGATIPATPTYLVDRMVPLPTITANLRFVDFDVTELPTITGGDWYIGFQAPNPAAGVTMIVDETTEQGRTLVSQNGGPLQVIPEINAMIRAVTLAGSVPSTVTTVSAASFGGATLAAESIVAGFGVKLATATASATTTPLPTTLAGTTVKVRDSAGTERSAPLFFVSPMQVNYLIPAGTTNGTATVTITSSDGAVATGTLNIASVVPSLFSANASGSGLAATVVFRRNAAGQDSFEPVVRFDAATSSFVAVPIDLGPAGDQVFLILYGTGFRSVSQLSNVTVRIGGQDAEVIFAGAAPGFVGLDQVNARIPRTLAGRGEVDIALTAAGQAANVVRVNVK